jgi:energy-coupling factor transporter ATP-binding protein EcfA2
MFELLADGLGVGEDVPAGWQRLADQAFVILVGGMGSGKSTLLQALQRTSFSHYLLPDRRVLTNQLIVAPQQRAAGLPVRILSRAERLPYIWRYQASYPAGMAYAISQLWLDPHLIRDPIIFDGLRGEEEARFALENMPRANFFCLSCPARVRLERLLIRHDPYDQFGSANADLADHPESFAQLDLDEKQLERAERTFTSQDRAALLDLVRSGEVTSLELRQRLSLLLEEINLYDIPKAIHLLQERAGERALVVKTERHLPEAVTNRLLVWLCNQSSFTH